MSINRKKILITGGAGFIGTNFVHVFLEMGNTVSVFETKQANLWRIENIKSKLKIYYPDLTNYKKTEKLIAKIRPDIVLHFATYGAYQKTQQDVKTTIDTNILATINLINACQAAKVKCFINTSTSSEYGIKNKPMKETDTLEPDNFYGVTKSATTLYGQMMAKKYGFPVVSTRLFAVYGSFEQSERLIPTITLACLKNSPLKLSSSSSVRDFIFIEDIVSAYLAIIKNIKSVRGEIFNIGSGNQYTIKDVVTLVKELTDSNVKPQFGKIPVAQTEPKTWVADISKAKKMLGWKPKHTLKDGLKKNIVWFQNNAKN